MYFPFSHHYQGSIDFNTVNIEWYDLHGFYFPIHSLVPRECIAKYCPWTGYTPWSLGCVLTNTAIGTGYTPWDKYQEPPPQPKSSHWPTIQISETFIKKVNIRKWPNSPPAETDPFTCLNNCESGNSWHIAEISKSRPAVSVQQPAQGQSFILWQNTVLWAPCGL